VKLTFGKPRVGVPERENAIITGRFGHIIGFWDVTEPELRKCFKGRDHAYFYAHVDGEVKILGPAPDQDW
jgi:hypothetical protein